MPYAYVPQQRFAEPPPFEPSSWMLMKMIEAAEAKCDKWTDIDRKEAARARSEHVAAMAQAHNARVIREARAHDMRRHMNVGDAHHWHQR